MCEKKIISVCIDENAIYINLHYQKLIAQNQYFVFRFKKKKKNDNQSISVANSMILCCKSYYDVKCELMHAQI